MEGRGVEDLPGGAAQVVSGGGAAPEIVRYVYRDGRYEAVPAGDIAGVRGRAILCGWSGPRRLQP